VLKVRLKNLKFEFCQFKLGVEKHMYAISCQNFARVRLQLKFAFITRLINTLVLQKWFLRTFYGLSINDIRYQGIVQGGHFSDKVEGGSSDADVRTFWCKKFRICRNL